MTFLRDCNTIDRRYGTIRGCGWSRIVNKRKLRSSRTFNVPSSTFGVRRRRGAVRTSV